MKEKSSIRMSERARKKEEENRKKRKREREREKEDEGVKKCINNRIPSLK